MNPRGKQARGCTAAARNHLDVEHARIVRSPRLRIKLQIGTMRHQRDYVARDGRDAFVPGARRPTMSSQPSTTTTASPYPRWPIRRPSRRPWRSTGFCAA